MAYAISIELIMIIVFIVFKIQVKYTIYEEKNACIKSGQCWRGNPSLMTLSICKPKTVLTSSYENIVNK